MDKVTRISKGSNGGPTGLMSGLLRHGSVRDFRAAAPLPKDAQEMVDEAVVNVGLDRLVIVGDLLAAGLTFPLPNWLAVPELYWEKVDKVGHAQRTMNPNTQGERQVQDREGTRIPIYCTLDDFSFGIRELMAAERAGAPLDTAHVEQATRRVNEGIEDAMINGAGITVGGNSAPGLLNAPNVASYTYESNTKWDDAGKTGENILTDVLAMIDLLKTNRKFGPYNLYIPTDYGGALSEDFKSNSDKTVRQRLLELEKINSIKEADMLPDDTTVLLQPTRDVVDVIVGDEPTPVSWEHPSGWERYFVVLACMVPRVKDTHDDKSGICVGTDS